jgi:hypothetical protein
MTQSADTNDTRTCPLCGQPNEGAVAAGWDPDSCWCRTVTMSPDALASIPAEARGKVCICARCATGQPVGD